MKFYAVSIAANRKITDYHEDPNKVITDHWVDTCWAWDINQAVTHIQRIYMEKYYRTHYMENATIKVKEIDLGEED